MQNGNIKESLTLILGGFLNFLILNHMILCLVLADYDHKRVLNAVDIQFLEL